MAALVAVNAVGDIIDPATGRWWPACARRTARGSPTRARSCASGELGARAAAHAARRPRTRPSAWWPPTPCSPRPRRARSRRWPTTASRARSRPPTRRETATPSSRSPRARRPGEANVSLIGALAAEAMADAIVRAARQATGSAGVPAARDLAPRRPADETASAAPGLPPPLHGGGGRRVRRRPAIVRAQGCRPALTPTASPPATSRGGRAIVWSRADRPAAPGRRVVPRRDSFRERRGASRAGRVRRHRASPRAWTSPACPPGSASSYRVRFEDLADARAWRAPVTGSSGRRRRRPPRDVTLAWSADTVGQGWGINREWGGLRLYETMRQARAGRVRPLRRHHLRRPAPAPRGHARRRHDLAQRGHARRSRRSAETLDDFRGNYLYNLLDENVRRFNAEVPQVVALGRPRGARQLVPAGDPADDARYSGASGSPCWPRARGRPSSSTSPSAPSVGGAGPHLPIRFRTAPRSRSSRSTCARTVGRNSPNRQARAGPEIGAPGRGPASRWLEQAACARRRPPGR